MYEARFPVTGLVSLECMFPGYILLHVVVERVGGEAESAAVS
jgi:hypothetical protein